MVSPDPPAWLAYPGALVRLSLAQRRGRACLAMVGNPQGMASLSGYLLWLTAFSDHGSLSLSGLSFVAPEGRLALSVVMEMEREPFQGRLARLDKGEQFEWQIFDDDLQHVAKDIHRVATHADYIDYFEVSLSPDSDAELLFQVTTDA